jgi:hypothetical protein
VSPTLPLVLSIAAIVVAVVSAGAAVWSVRQTAQYHPKPLIVGQMKLGRTNGYKNLAEVLFEVSNRGNGDAHDFRVYQVTSRSRSETHSEARLKPGGSWDTRWFLTDQTTVTDHLEIVSGAGVQDPRLMWVVVEWRQAPNMRRIRRSEFRIGKPSPTSRRLFAALRPSIE